MVADFLHSFYRMPINLVIGGVPTQATIRWYRAPAGAKHLPFPSAIFSHVWDNNPGESQPGEIGEVGFPRTWDPGDNHGYQGQCYRGDPSWFATGQLPALPLPASPCVCLIPPAQASGGLVLTGSGSGFAGLTSCTQCTRGAPMKWQVTWTGLGGILAGGNGTFVLPYLAGCRWSVTVGSITYTLQFFTGFWSLTAVTGVHAQTFVPQTLFDCLGQTYWAATPGGQPGAVSVPYTGP